MSSTGDDFCQESLKRAFQNELIVEHLFSFLSLNDIKNCRLQNRVWRNIGTKILRRRTHVLFQFFTKGRIAKPEQEAIFLEKKKRMKEVSDYCKENTPKNTPISSFAFQGRFEYFHLANFLDDVRGYMRELEIVSGIYNIPPYTNWYHIPYLNKTVDISPKIPPHLTKLHIQLYSSTITLSLCFDQISFVKNIYLDNCTIILDTNGKRLSPNDISLGPDNKYIKNKTNVEFLVNESFNLTLTKRINLNGKNLIVDFSDCANDQVERTVTLKNITVRNWEKCNWKIKNFSLNGIPFLENNCIEIEELTVDDLQIDLSKIYNPPSLLKLYCCGNTVIADAPFFLPNVSDVALMCDNCVAKLPYFRNNKNISTMVLGGGGRFAVNAMSVNINDFPKGINELTLTEIDVHGEGVCQLQTLYMGQYRPISKYSTIGAKFRPETFKLCCHGIGRDEDEMQSVIQLLNLCDSNCRLIIGHFYWNSTLFNNSVISNYVDREATCYVFEGKRGKGLTTEETLSAFGYYIAN